MHAKSTKPLGWAIAAATLLCGVQLLAQEAANDAPVLSLSQAVEIALEHNRPVNIAKLDIDKSKWTLAQTKTKRFPAINTYLFASGDITSPTFNFPAGSFGFEKPQKFQLSSGLTGYASVQAAQPISQLYQIHLAIREQELSVDYSGEQYKGKRQSTAASVKQSYYSVLQTESALEAQQALVEAQRLVGRRRQLGLRRYPDVYGQRGHRQAADGLQHHGQWHRACNAHLAIGLDGRSLQRN